jgi:6-phosphofructokinase 1
MRAFLCHASTDADFVIQVARFLKVSMEKVFYFQDPEQNRGNFLKVLKGELAALDVMVVFVGECLTPWQEKELEAVEKRLESHIEVHVIFILRSQEEVKKFGSDYSFLNPSLVCHVERTDVEAAASVARKVLRKLHVPHRFDDGLPLNPHLFSYEKHIIDFFRKKVRLGAELFTEPEPDWTPEEQGGADIRDEPEVQAPTTEELRDAERSWRIDARQKLLDGCPSSWPKVERWEELIRSYKGKWPEIGKWREKSYKSELRNVVFRRHGNDVLAAALSTYHRPKRNTQLCLEECMVEQGLCFPEAGPRAALYFPPRTGANALNVAVLVSGGIAPGINAVIDGIVQRHWLYARSHNQAELNIYGLQNGFRALEAFAKSHFLLAPDHEVTLGDRKLVTSDHANQGGSMLGTSRVDELIDLNQRIARLETIVRVLRDNSIDILYVIGGDGSMKAAHAIWSFGKNTPGRPLSVVSVPKTMDNDVLWVWQAFGFLSAVEKAREIIEHLHTEVKSNPRLCILQLFGSDSGFVVSHSVLASATGHCDVALIPEVPFSMIKLAKVVKEKMCKRKQRIPYGLVVMAETAIPTDATDYATPKGETPKIDIGLSRDEQDEILKFQKLRDDGKRIQGQTSDVLRAAGLKIVKEGLKKLLPGIPLDKDKDPGFHPEWDKLRVLTNEPRHILRSASPSCADIIVGQRLGMLAVDNAMAGDTDFMISQWLTEYVVVPLNLVVLGRKRIPSTGIFWKSVLEKTHQPEDMVC